MTNNEILLKLAKKNYGKYLTPTGNVSAKKVNRYYTDKDKAVLDTATCSDLIGKIINCSQIINSRIWEAVKRGDFKEAEYLYIVTSQLDVMSNLAIDSAKREFNCDLKKEFDMINKKYISTDLKPKFFEFISKDKGNKVKKEKYRWYETSMDYLLKIIERESRRKVGNGSIKTGLDLTSLIIGGQSCSGEHSKINRVGVENILTKGLKIKNEINQIWANKSKSDDSQDRFFKVNQLNYDFEYLIKNTVIKPIDIKHLIYKIEKKDEYLKVRKYVLDKLYKNKSEIFLEIFREK